LLLTDHNNAAATGAVINNGKSSVPFPDFVDDPTELNELRELSNARVWDNNGTRLNMELVTEAVARMPRPCRFVVSGPSSFNATARTMLQEASVDVEAITILEA
jgi:hypothetical protein